MGLYFNLIWYIKFAEWCKKKTHNYPGLRSTVGKNGDHLEALKGGNSASFLKASLTEFSPETSDLRIRGDWASLLIKFPVIKYFLTSDLWSLMAFVRSVSLNKVTLSDSGLTNLINTKYSLSLVGAGTLLINIKYYEIYQVLPGINNINIKHICVKNINITIQSIVL